jgi:hypothetical protein
MNMTHGDLMIALLIEHDVSVIVKEAIEKHGATKEALIPMRSIMLSAIFQPTHFKKSISNLTHKRRMSMFQKASFLGLPAFMTCSPRNQEDVT